MTTTALTKFCEQANRALRDDPDLASRLSQSLAQLIADGPRQTVNFLLAYAASRDDLWSLLYALDDLAWRIKEAVPQQAIH